MNLRFSSLTMGCVLAAACTLPAAVQAQAGAACLPSDSHADSLNACAVQRFQQADAAQNIRYADVMRALSAHERPALRKDQTAWSRLRTSQCKAAHAKDEGLADWPQRFHDCLTQMTQQRQTALMHWLHEGRAPDL